MEDNSCAKNFFFDKQFDSKRFSIFSTKRRTVAFLVFRRTDVDLCCIANFVKNNQKEWIQKGNFGISVYMHLFGTIFALHRISCAKVCYTNIPYMDMGIVFFTWWDFWARIFKSDYSGAL